jgi:hypothetical protein
LRCADLLEAAVATLAPEAMPAAVPPRPARSAGAVA